MIPFTRSLYFFCDQGIQVENMRILFLSDEATILLDIVAWICFHLSIGYMCSRFPRAHFDPQKSWYLTKAWEEGGEIYQKLFRVKDWKRFIPSGAALYKKAYEVKNITSFSVTSVKTWLVESCRSEFCHWAMILPGFFFFLWNNVEAGWWMVAYAVVNNMVPIIMQRYNRPRARKLLAHIQKESMQEMEPLLQFGPQQTLSHSYK